MVKYIGSYNIDNEGEIWNGNTRYIMVIFSRFDENEKEIERKQLYFRSKCLISKLRNRSRNFSETKRITSG